MKLKIAKQKDLDIIKLIKRCGYTKFKDQPTGQISFTHRLGSYFYPRFHLYINRENDKEIILTIHLDQKKPSYEGCRAHGADYDGILVEKEAKRIKNYIENEK